MHSPVDIIVGIAKAALLIGAAFAIIAIGQPEGWFKTRQGIIIVAIGFYLMASTAFPIPVPATWQLTITLAVLGVGAFLAIWTPPGLSNIERELGWLAEAINERRQTHYEERYEEVEYVPVSTSDNVATGRVPQ